MNKVIQQNLSDYAGRAYLEYALSVVKGRAIPCVEDGLKPVHRRIIYSMFKEGMVFNSIYKKSARVVGDVLGKYHPHGDQSVYDALVRQAQDFSVRYPLIEGQGNFGSRDGDGAASMRYTEAKLAKISQLYLDELKEQCVDFMPNYDGEESEPCLMPSRVPFILLNGNPGIGVGMATSIPSHNITEVINAVIAYLSTEEPTLDTLLEYIKGPDFNTGGQIISSQSEIRKIYEEGNGSYRMRSKYLIEDEGTKNWKIVFYEIPSEVSVKTIMEQIDDIFNPEAKLKGKKDSKGKDKKPSIKQINQKNLFTTLIGKYTDASDRKNPCRLVIEPKSNKLNPETIVQTLLGYTSLESNQSANFVMIGRDGRPVLKNLMQTVAEWVDFRVETVRRRTEYQIKRLAERLHILEGRSKILSNIDEVVKLIKDSEDAKKDLMEQYGLSEIQAQDVLDLRLRQLGRLELSNIQKEMNENIKKTNDLKKIIENEKSIKRQIVKELKSDVETYGDERITEVKAMEKVDLNKIEEKANMNSQEDVTVAVSNKEWVKTVKGHKKPDEIVFKEGDNVNYSFNCKNTDTLAIFDAEGKVYNYPLMDINKDGSPINTLAQMGAKLSLACPINKEHSYVIVQDCGLGFIVAGDVLSTRVKTGKDMVSIAENSNLMQPLYFPNTTTAKDYKVAIITSEQKLLIYPLDLVSTTRGKAQGVKLVSLPVDQKIKTIKIIKEDKLQVVATGKSGKKQIFNLEGDSFNNYVKGRATKGSVLSTRDKDATIEFGEDVEAAAEENQE
jgi:topoisomerase-4 subunit A